MLPLVADADPRPHAGGRAAGQRPAAGARRRSGRGAGGDRQPGATSESRPRPRAAAPGLHLSTEIQRGTERGDPAWVQVSAEPVQLPLVGDIVSRVTLKADATMRMERSDDADSGHERRRGNAAIVMLSGIAFLMVLLVGLTDLRLFIARTKAQTAADSAVLAAVAELIPVIGEDPEGNAEEYAEANGARLLECVCEMGEPKRP